MSHKCSKCNKLFTLQESNSDWKKGTYRREIGCYSHMEGSNNKFAIEKNKTQIEYFICPDINCNNIDVRVSGVEDFLDNRVMWINPISNHKVYPDIDPEIDKYYTEAHAVLKYSPRASAALSRACLESILLTRYKINAGNLYKTIDEFEKQVKDGTIRITYDFVDALDGIRHAGNASLHENLKTEISYEEAESILFVIEIFLDEIYINEKIRAEKFSAVKKLNPKA